jgi:biotin-dependent carboxylase-like uncharacterized protein
MTRLEIRSVGLAFVQDGGRPGRMAEGVPRGGALVPDALLAANEAVGNEAGAAAIERFGAMAIAADAPVVVSDELGRAREIAAGEEVHLPWDGARRARYLAVRGGLDVPSVLGGRGTLLVAKLGGHEGRPLRRGDRLAIGSAVSDCPPVERERADEASPIRIVPGPDLARYAPVALEALVGRRWRLSPTSDRTGTRLEGAPIAWSPSAPPARTTPMIAGAIELPPSGEPIVLGPDHPTTGGYPVVAVVRRADLGRFHARPLGASVRFSTD